MTSIRTSQTNARSVFAFVCAGTAEITQAFASMMLGAQNSRGMSQEAAPPSRSGGKITPAHTKRNRLLAMLSEMASSLRSRARSVGLPRVCTPTTKTIAGPWILFGCVPMPLSAHALFELEGRNK